MKRFFHCLLVAEFTPSTVDLQSIKLWLEKLHDNIHRWFNAEDGRLFLQEQVAIFYVTFQMVVPGEAIDTKCAVAFSNIWVYSQSPIRNTSAPQKSDRVVSSIVPENWRITVIMWGCFQIKLLFIILGRNIGIFLRRFTIRENIRSFTRNE